MPGRRVRRRPLATGVAVKSIDAFALRIAETNLIYTIDDAGRITPMSLATYEALRFPDRRLLRVVDSRAKAERLSLRVRGIETGFEIQRN